MKKTLCVAGKNQIAVNALKYIQKNYSEHDIYFIPNKGDTGTDDWQPSFKKYGITSEAKQTSIDEIKSASNLIFLSLEFAEIIKPREFTSSELFNIHFSLLPKYKGMYTSAIPLLFGEEKSGVTLHKIDCGIDTGEIIDQIEFEISPNDTARDMYFNYLNQAEVLLLKNIDDLINGKYSTSPQPAKGSSYFSKKAIDYSKITIDHNKTAWEIHNQYRAFTFREYQIPKFQEWEISKTEITKTNSTKKPGTIVCETENNFTISTIDYDLKLHKDYYNMLWEASKDGDLEKFDLAAKNIDDIELKNKSGWNALIIAAFHGKTEIIKRLFSLGANSSATNHKGTTALMYAFSNYEATKNKSAFDLILNHGANANATDSAGKSLADYMVERGCTDLLGEISNRPQRQ